MIFGYIIFILRNLYTIQVIAMAWNTAYRTCARCLRNMHSIRVCYALFAGIMVAMVAD